MAEMAPVERLQPFLLDRLTDDQPEKKMESREYRVMSVRDLRNAILRDLTWLLNTGNHALEEKLRGEGVKLGDYPEAAKSVVNFGMPPLSGRTASSMKPENVERAIRNALQNYEPRILRESLRVKVVEPEKSGAPYVLQLEIQGEVWNLPMPEALFVRTSVDLDTGQWSLADTSK